MSRPRTPAAILKLRGSFVRNPGRYREDAPGAGVFCADRPEHLLEFAAAAWVYLVERLPAIVLTSSDEMAVERAAVCLAALWKLEETGGLLCATSEFRRLEDGLRAWLMQLGMTPAARTKLAPTPPPGRSRFAQFTVGPRE